jgi:hypothetical protein
LQWGIDVCERRHDSYGRKKLPWMLFRFGFALCIPSPPGNVADAGGPGARMPKLVAGICPGWKNPKNPGTAALFWVSAPILSTVIWASRALKREEREVLVIFPSTILLLYESIDPGIC